MVIRSNKGKAKSNKGKAPHTSEPDPLSLVVDEHYLESCVHR
jgi:hypothetical protein